MRPGDDTTELARLMLKRKQSGFQPPYILFLGQECADAAGVPSNVEIARQIFADPALKERYLSHAGLSDNEAIQAAFEDLLEDMTTGQRYRLLQNYHANVPVPTFYQDLALLVKAGFFEHILTTNIDNLLEQALIGAGLAEGRDYEVLVLGQTEELPWRRKTKTPEKARITIIKLHGDLIQQRVAITRDEISDALEPQRSFIKGQIAGDMVTVGYRLESEPLNAWLSWVPGEVWWVGAGPEDEGTLRTIEARRQVFRISGEGAAPEAIFGQLVWLLLRSPSQAIQAAAEPVESLDDDQAEVSAGNNLPGEEYSDAAFIETQLRRSRALLIALEQSLTPGEKNPQIDAQIDYQRRQIAELEARLRDLEPNRLRLLELMHSVSLSVKRAARKDLVDKNAASYVNKQWNTVQGEYQRETPNQSIVAAAVGATVVLAQRLGEQVVDPKVIQQLAAYAPSAMGLR